MIDKISVIIPVYNVEKYIEKCVKSILNQTLKNYELILVDDGSTDNSGKICDKLACENNNINVYHKTNGGLSDARNYGVNKSSGKYITFIDSDDYVRCDYLELLYNAMEKKAADISVVHHQVVYENTDFSLSFNKSEKDNIEVISGKELLKHALLGEKGSLSAWAKLYKREYVLAYPFPFGELYEDMEVLYNIYLYASRVAIVDGKAYFYLHRDKSIVHSRVTERHLYGVKSCIHMLQNNNQKNNGFEKYIKCRIVMQACGHLPNLVEYKDKDMFEKISVLVKKHIKAIIFKREAPIKLKIRAISYLLDKRVGLLYAKCFLNTKKVLVSIKNNKVVNNL